MQTLTTVKVGFIPLVDCALLTIAREKGFAEARGINLELYKEVSWANIRDKMYLGYFDGAQMLSGMSLASNLKLMPNSSEIFAPFVLGRNGNAITVSHQLFDEMNKIDPDVLESFDLSRTGAALKAVIEKRKQEGKELLRFGMVFPYSSHNYHLRYWMAACGIDPDVDVKLEVIPPPFMDQNLEKGFIDGFCVGEPWNSLAVAQDTGVIIAATAQIWSQSPEKLLGLRKDWVQENPKLVQSLLLTLDDAAKWVSDEGNISELATLLSGHDYLAVPAEIIHCALTGNLNLKKNQGSVQIENFLTLSGEGANCPSYNEANWLIEQMKRWGQIDPCVDTSPSIESAFCQKLYTEALATDVPDGQIIRPFDVA
jgi:ABC-type nitrate/sulfonate/bicarbonate transport system substrate-binding protein